jgi:branched-subunit amino acid aminotransferase/4-amino-4-deoxychorismate lyase
MIQYYNINGQQVPAASASLHVSDLSILRGYGIFDYFLAREGHPLFLQDYLNRFYRSAQELYLEIPFSQEEMKRHIYALLEANGVKEAGIRLVLTGGYSPDGYTPAASPNLLILMYELPGSAWEFSTQGIKIITHPFQRELPEVKTINYSTGIRMLKTVKERGATDLVYIDQGQWIRESARSNFFLVLPDDTIVTADEKILWGITRRQVIDAARAAGYTVEERPIHVSELDQAQEAFFTSTIKGVMSIGQIDERVYGDGSIGRVTKVLQGLFLEKVKGYLRQLG